MYVFCESEVGKVDLRMGGRTPYWAKVPLSGPIACQQQGIGLDEGTLAQSAVHTLYLQFVTCSFPGKNGWSANGWKIFSCEISCHQNGHRRDEEV